MLGYPVKVNVLDVLRNCIYSVNGHMAIVITNFKRNLAMMVIYLPVKFEFDSPKCLIACPSRLSQL